MTYFKINNTDYSAYVSELKVNDTVNYNAQTNAAGNTVVDFINRKREIEVSIIPLADGTVVKGLLEKLNEFNLSISFRNPRTGELETINCIIPSNDIEYYTIQVNKVMYKTFSLTFTEL